MQTPLITNFSRGILSPKFLGRVDSELYHAGVAELLNFIVNNQGSVQRRPGTYRIWNTRVTAPAPAGQDTDRFAIQYSHGQEYTLTVVNEFEGQAQLILSTLGTHQFFQLEIGADELGAGTNGLTLSKDNTDEGAFPIAYSFTTGETGAIVDDSFISSFGDVTFMRTRSWQSASGYRAKVWHAQASPQIAEESDSIPPFVNIKPLLPPTYDNTSSKLYENIGYQVEWGTDQGLQKVVHSDEKAQYVGQLVTGLSSVITETAYLKDGTLYNAAMNALSTGEIVLSVPVIKPWSADQPATYLGKLDRPYQFYEAFPGDAAVFFGSMKLDSKLILETNKAAATVTIDLAGLQKVLTGPANTDSWGDWTSVDDINWDRFYVQYRGIQAWCSLIVFGSCMNWKYQNVYSKVKVSYTFPKHLYQNNTYEPQSSMGWSGDPYDYALWYEMASGQRVGLDRRHWKITGTPGGNVTGVTIRNELWMNPVTGKLVDPTAKYFLERKPFTEDYSVIGRRALPYTYNETASPSVIEHVAEQEEWLDFSENAVNNSATVIMHGKRTILNMDGSLRFRVSRMRDYANFAQGESELDAYDLTIETERAEQLRWAVSVRDGIVIGTDKNEYVLIGVDSPSSVAVRRFTSIGSARPYAIRFGDKILFISRDAKRIMAYSYSDELSAWYSSDITSVAQHLFTDGIQSMCYMADPVSAIWVVPNGNHGLLCLSWEPATGVMAWSRHFEGVNVLSVKPVTIAEKTTLVVAVERGGYVVIEGMDLTETEINNVGSYADSSEYLKFVWDDSEDENGIDGPDNLPMNGSNYEMRLDDHRWARFQGQQLIFYIENDVVKVVDDPTKNHINTVYTIGPYEGADIYVELTAGEGRTVTVGYPFKSQLKTLPILVQSPTGAGVFKNTQVRKMRMRVDQSRSFLVGNDLSDLTQVDLSESESLIEDEDTGHFTGDIEVEVQSRWMKRPEVYVESYYGDPLNLLAMMVDTSVYE